jgi:hypothetical protein
METVFESAIAEEARTESSLQMSGAIQLVDGWQVVNRRAEGRASVSAPSGVQGEENIPVSLDREDWLFGRRSIAKNIKEKTKWFRTRTNLGLNLEWNIKMIWAKDNNRQFLSVPKA